jgi:DNA-directed RNA polymerase specialized sigma24 family protein
MSTKQTIDFHFVEDHQRDIDRRLQNWGKWCNGSGSPSVSPMFRMCPPPPRVRRDVIDAGNSVDTADAAQVSKAVSALPVPHRAAVNWAYVRPVSPRRACQELGTTMAGLALLLRDGRQMLINRKI